MDDSEEIEVGEETEVREDSDETLKVDLDTELIELVVSNSVEADDQELVVII